MVSNSVFLFLLLIITPLAVHADTIRKFEDESGTTVYSDRQQLPGAKEVGTVKLPPGPSEAEQAAAKERVNRTRNTADEMEKSRLSAHKESTAKNNSPMSEMDQLEAGSTNLDNNRSDPKQRIPVEMPAGGEHKIYQPIQGKSVHATPLPSPGGGGRK